MCLFLSFKSPLSKFGNLWYQNVQESVKIDANSEKMADFLYIFPTDISIDYFKFKTLVIWLIFFTYKLETNLARNRV